MSLISILLFHHFCSASSNHIITTVKTSWNIQGKLLARGQTYWPQAPKLDTLAEVPTLGASLVGFQAPLVRHLGYSGRRSFKGQRASPRGRLGGLGGRVGGTWEVGGGHLGGGSPAHLPLLHSLLRSAAPTPPNAHFLTVSSQYFGSFRVFITFQYICKEKWSWVIRKIFQVGDLQTRLLHHFHSS